MNYRVEFPDYPAADMPAIPRGFVDESWHNDACPSFRNSALKLTLFVDYAEPSQREFPESVRFSVVMEDDELAIDSDRLQLYAGNDWQEVQAVILARAFAAQLLADIGPDNLATVNEHNASNGESVCASHDFCDSNMSMFSAFQKTFGRDPAFLFRDEGDAKADSDLELWNRAWDLAKANLFFAESGNGAPIVSTFE